MPAKSAIFLDANAGLPLHPRARQALIAALEESGGEFPFNPASPHSLGQRSRAQFERSRALVLSSLVSEELSKKSSSGRAGAFVFTGSGTEANQWVIRSILESPVCDHHWVTSAAEHDSILQMIPWARARGIHVTILPLQADGQPCFETFQKALDEPCKPTLISLLWVNNETGVVLSRPVLGDWIKAAHSAQAAVHLDGAQAWGKFKLELDRLGADFVTFSGHKIGGMAGSGGVWISPERAAMAGGSAGRLILGKAEGGRRGGTSSVVAALLLGEAASAVQQKSPECEREIEQLSSDFEAELLKRFGDSVTINGKSSTRVPGTTNVSFHGVSGEGLVAALDLEGFAVSAGAACSSGTLEPSHVLLAMGVSPEVARASIRVSLPREGQKSVTGAELARFLDALERVVGRMRRASGLNFARGAS